MMKIYKNFLDDLDKEVIYNSIRSPDWRFGNYSKSDLDLLFWKQDLMDNSFYTDYLYNKIVKLIGEDLFLGNVYFNGHCSSTHGSLHQDSLEDVTFLIYCNHIWDVNWGGGTIFVLDEKIEYVCPQPFSGVYFNGNIFHCAQPLSKLFTGLRVTLAYRLSKSSKIK